MLQQSVSESKSLRMPAISVPWIAAIGVLALTLFTPSVIDDGDTFLHVTAGDWMITHHAIPHSDPFSYSRLGAPWVAHEWLSEILMAAAFRAAGLSGVVVLTAAALALAFFQLGRHVRRWLPADSSLLLLLLAVACITPLFFARPHLLALPTFEAWAAGLFIARSMGRAPSWRLLPVMCLWANLHGSFMFGLFLTLPLTLEALLAEPAAWRTVLVGWGGFLLAATAAALLTPHGVEGLLFPFQLTGMAELSMIGEWQPTVFSGIQPLEVVLTVGLYLALTRGARLPLLRLLMLLGLLHLALHHARHQMLIGIVVPLLIAEPLGVALLPHQPKWQMGRWRAGSLATMAGLVALRLLLPVTRGDSPMSPVTALAHVPPDLAVQPVLNEWNFGSYMIFAHVRPFIDGRADMYGGAFLRQYARITRPNRTALETTLRDYGIRWTIFAIGNPAIELLDAMPHWCRIYADDVAVVHAAAC